MAHSNRELQNKFIDWLRTPPAGRGDIASEAEWGRRHGVTDRTLRRWKSAPGFEERLNSTPDPEPTEDVPPAGDQADYQVVKTALVDGAKAGNPKYLELYFRTYGKPFVEEEVASRSTDLSGIDIDELVARTVAALDPNALAKHLQSIGWRVEKP
jgi:hypothetical protein